MKQVPLDLGMRSQPGLDNFVVGANAAALAQLRSMDRGSPPLYLWGPAGCGKSHLLRGLAAAVDERGGRTGGFDATGALPWDFDPAWDLVIVDHCDNLDPSRQQGAFALFVEAGAHRAMWVAAGRLPPVDLGLRDDLRTRLAWGHVYAVQPLPDALVRSTLQREAGQRGFELPDDLMDYLLIHLERDLGHLMKLLDRLDRFALISQRRMSLTLLRRMLTEESGA
jgi:DnaA family protein